MAGVGQIVWQCSRAAARRYRSSQHSWTADLGCNGLESNTRIMITRNYETAASLPRPFLVRGDPRNCAGGDQPYVLKPTSVTITTAAGNSAAAQIRAFTSSSEAQRDQQRQQAEDSTEAQAVAQEAITLDGKASSAAWLSELRPSVQEVTEALGRPPSLCVIHVGDRPDSDVYVRRKEEVCAEMQVSSQVVRLPASVGQEELFAAIDAACASSEVDGVLVQLPLPPHLNEYDVMERVDPRKDVDGFHPLNMGRMLARNAPPRFVPATALGCMQLLKRHGICVLKKHVVVVGDSNIVGTPLSVLLRDAGAGTVTVCHRIAYNNLFEDRAAPDLRQQLHADACLPRLPGPYSPEAVPKDGQVPWLSAASGFGDEDSHRRSPHDASAARHSALGQSFNDMNSAPATTSTGARSYSSHSDSSDADDVDTLRQLSGILGERARATASPAGSKGGWDDMQLAALTRTADILVVAVGFPELVRENWVKHGAIVLDVGINIVPNDASAACSSGIQQGTIVGDVASRDVSKVASALTPVPGGIGPMTIAALIHNVVLAGKYRTNIQKW